MWAPSPTNNLKITYTSIKITKLQFTTCANKERVLKYTLLGGVAQLVERSVRIRKVKSSTLSVSTTEACYLDRLLFFYILKLIGESNSIVHVRRFAAGGGARTYNRIFAKQMKKACLFLLSPSPPKKSTLLRAFFNEIRFLRNE